MKFVSSFPLNFSSWKTETAYVPGAVPANSQIACPYEISDAACATALSVFLGKSAAEEKREQRTRPLSLCIPTISTWIRFSFESGTCAILGKLDNRLRKSKSSSPDVRTGFKEFSLPPSTNRVTY